MFKIYGRAVLVTGRKDAKDTKEMILQKN